MSPVEIHLPDLGEGLAEAEVVAWLIRVGERVEEHQPIVEVQTDKAVTEIPSPVRGVVVALGAQVGDVVPVGGVLLIIESVDNEPSILNDEPLRAASSSEASSPTPSAAGRAGVRASPVVRKMAKELGIDLRDVPPTGPGGIITQEDVLGVPSGSSGSAPISTAKNESGEGSKLSVQHVPLRGRRRVIARNMMAAARVPQVTGHREVEISALLELRNRLNDSRSDGRPAITFIPLLASCVINALSRVPSMNSTFDSDKEIISIYENVNIGVAVASEDGLLVPVIHDANKKGLRELADEIEEKAARARRGALRPAEMEGGTFTITNYGARGGWLGTPLIRLPEVAIAGFGRIALRPWVEEGQVVAAPILPISVSADHRLIDGDVLSQFVNALSSYLQDPEQGSS